MALVFHTVLSCLTLPQASVNGIPSLRPLLAVIFDQAEKREGLYNILWAVVFGFATLNILGLLARRFESGRQRLSFGEIAAIMVVAVSVLLLGWEMLGLFKIFPIRLGPR